MRHAVRVSLPRSYASASRDAISMKDPVLALPAVQAAAYRSYGPPDVVTAGEMLVQAVVTGCIHPERVRSAAPA